ncbi:MAG: C40 family peptidase [Gammaproteobacteria bacterium]|nr:C40 family peptidase [Gammaproteobacteria bacterium]
MADGLRLDGWAGGARAGAAAVGSPSRRAVRAGVAGRARGRAGGAAEQHSTGPACPTAWAAARARASDCSGFIQLTYLQRFGVELPRDTSAQRGVGSKVAPSRLRPGDLVFFDTGPAERHVGIYVGKRQFLHVSSSTGVMLSRLDDGYWGTRFRDAIRVATH